MPAITDAQRRALQLTGQRQIYTCDPGDDWPVYWYSKGRPFRSPNPRTMTILRDRGLIIVGAPREATSARYAELTDAGRAVLAERGDA